ncbi:MAG: hypothetical protein HOP12_08035 [Candidatus Eisenbacteria bacterium]|uniref:DUF2029 domain-containing protein n=1 Tax=Eiseniibacteriota bacterium TaxID=2212470 RepID=A0A849SNB8_UNCEI|nr:hypothetical protein [Candidatus Eisenbacteria bacterium]
MSGSAPQLRVIRGGRAAVADSAPEDPRPALELLGLGTALVFVCVLLARLPSWRAELGTFQALAAVAFVAWGAALWRAQPAAAIRHAGLLVLGIAVAARLALLPVAPTLSDDVYRYVWEGKVTAQGGDPYRQPPLDPALASLRDRDIHPRVNHPELAAIYPPLAMAGFALVARVSATVAAFKLWIVLWDIALCAALLWWCRVRGVPALAAIAYAWNPLVLIEYAGTAHYDPIALLPLVLAFGWTPRRPMAAAVALVVASLTRLMPIVALPFLWREWPWRARLLAVCGIGAGVALYVNRSLQGPSGLAAYARHWQHNEALFTCFAWIPLDPVAGRVLVTLGVASIAAFQFFRVPDVVRTFRRTLGSMLLFAPVVQPWYLGWVLVFEPIQTSRFWLFLSFTVLASYGVFAPPAAGGAWHPPLGVRLVEYGLPVLAAALLAKWDARGHEPRA